MIYSIGDKVYSYAQDREGIVIKSPGNRVVVVEFPEGDIKEFFEEYLEPGREEQ